jgi:hypothetical protein
VARAVLFFGKYSVSPYLGHPVLFLFDYLIEKLRNFRDSWLFDWGFFFMNLIISPWKRELKIDGKNNLLKKSN